MNKQVKEKTTEEMLQEIQKKEPTLRLITTADGFIILINRNEFVECVETNKNRDVVIKTAYEILTKRWKEKEVDLQPLHDFFVYVEPFYDVSTIRKIKTKSLNQLYIYLLRFKANIDVIKQIVERELCNRER